MKTCTKCRAEFPATTEYFYSDKDKSCGLSPSCITCKKENQRSYNSGHVEENRTRSRRNRIANGRTYDLTKHYGINEAAYDAMFNAQGGVCAICLAPPKGTGKLRLAVDHDHVNGNNRGLLCALCNHALERMETIPYWHEKAILYLTKFALAKMEKELK